MNTLTKQIQLFAGMSSNGNEVREALSAYELESGDFKLAVSPALVIGVAAGDVVRITNEFKGYYELQSRGGNLCVQMFYEPAADLEQYLTKELLKLGATLDGLDTKVIVYTVPLRSGFQAVEKELNDAVSLYAGSEWYYGNVYEEDGVTPLNWW